MGVEELIGEDRAGKLMGRGEVTLSVAGKLWERVERGG